MDTPELTVGELRAAFAGQPDFAAARTVVEVAPGVVGEGLEPSVRLAVGIDALGPKLVVRMFPAAEADDEEEDGPRYTCPNCGAVDQLDVVVQCWARINQTDPANLETDIDTSDQAWDEGSLMRCSACNHSGLEPTFVAANQPDDPEP
jgi:hypothetical protein